MIETRAEQDGVPYTPEIWGEEADIYDVDDTLVGRQWYVRMGGVIKGGISFLRRKMGHHSILPTLEDIKNKGLDHTPKLRVILGLVEAVAFDVHAARKAIDGLPERVYQRVKQGVHVYVASGRPASVVWDYETVEELRRGRFPEFRGIFLTPEDERTYISKTDVVAKVYPHYKRTNVFDDDGTTIRNMAEILKGVRSVHLYLVKYGFSNRPGVERELDNYENAHIIHYSDWKR